MSSANPTDLLLRPATAADLPAVAAVHRRARAVAVDAGTMPRGVHGEDALDAWVASWIGTAEVWVAERAGVVVAYARLTAAWLDDLYVAPEHAGDGIGSALLDLVKGLRPDGFGLWVFEVNRPARRFYARHGLVEVERTDGRDNEERAPDVHLAWEP